MSEAPELTTDAMQEAYEKLKSWGFAAGSYHCFCSECGKTHTADKRAWRCLECAEKRASLDMIDPAALVAGAYEAVSADLASILGSKRSSDASDYSDGFNDGVNHGLEEAIDAVISLTPADAQAALDAAIAKAVNEKLDKVLKAVTFQSYADYVEGKPLAYVDGHSDACTLLYKNILAMKEEG